MRHSLPEQVASAGAAAIRFVQSGGKWVTREVRKERLDTCKACDQYEKNRCKWCGCFLSIKTWLPAEKCPLDPPKWEAV